MFDMTASPTATHGEMKTYEKDTPYGSLAMYIQTLEDKEVIYSTPELEEEIANLLIDISQKHLQESEFTEYGSNRKRRKVSETEDSDMDYKEFEEIVHGGEEEDFYVEEELDDDWKESRNALMTSSMVSPKNSRKKAPSGTACEKHKRWKKRCPEDCPMRKQKSKKLSPTLSRKSRYSEDSNSDQDDIAEDRTMYNRKRMPEDLFENISDDEFEGKIAPIKRRNGGRRPIGATIACERHTAMHARCPPHCPDRRPSGSNRIKKSRDSDDSDFDSNSDMSPVNNMEEFEENKENFIAEDEIKNVLFSKFSEELPKSPRIQMKALVADAKVEVTSPTSSRKSPKAPRNKGTRKYLPQACDRHKMLHAKCPANCPDRLRRDMEKGITPSSSVTSPPTLTVTLIAHN